MTDGKYEYKISTKIAARIADLAERLYDFLPDVSWKTEENLAKELNVNRRQIRNAKKYLIDSGKLTLQLRQNGKRSNATHTLVKPTPINQDIIEGWLDESDNTIDWSLLSDLAARELNEMPLDDKLEFYGRMRLPFFPLHYPKFNKNGKPFCSCSRGKNCDSIGKHPAIAYSELDFSNELTFREMRSFWLEDYLIDNVDCNNSYNIGLKTDEFVVIDVDYRNGGAYSLEWLQENYGELPLNLTVKSGNGLHIYARTNKSLKTDSNVLGLQGIDIRSKGSFIVTPFSDHHSGNKYEWLSVSPPEILPQSFIDDLHADEIQFEDSVKSGKKIETDSNLPSRFDTDYVIPNGARNSTLFRLASRERGAGAEQAAVFNYLKTVNSKHCLRPLDERELMNIAKSVMKYKPEREKRREGQIRANI
jgi:hypothetical protein